MPTRKRSAFWRRRRTPSAPEFSAEIQSHIDLETDRLIADGMSPAGARAEARRRFGSVAATEERFYESTHVMWLDHLRRDVRFALRTFRRSLVFTSVAVLTLALGIGATTAIFTAVYAILLRPLPYHDPDRLVELHIRGGDGNVYPLPDTDFIAWRDRAEAFEQVAVFDNGGGATLSGGREPERLIVGRVTARFFDILGVPAASGRVFRPDEDRPGVGKTVVLSDRLWRRSFRADPGAIGQTVLLDGTPHTIVGVMPASFTFGTADVDAWAILTMAPPPRRGPFYTNGVGRLRANETLAHAHASLEAIANTLKQQHPGPGDWTFELVPLQEWVVGDVRRILYFLFAAVAFLLLIATANVANLFLARAAARDREMAVRGALGAGRGRLAAQLITESVLLAGAGGVIGLAIAIGGSRALVSMASADMPRLDEVGVTLGVFLFALIVSIASGVVFGLAPVFRMSRTPNADSLKDANRGSSGVHHRRVQRLLVVTEIALAVILSIGAGLMVRSFAALTRVNPGFTSARLLTFSLNLPQQRYDTPEKVAAFYDTLESRLLAAPGVESVGTAASLPPDLLSMTDNFMVEGQTLPPNQSAPVGPLLFVNDAYFRTLGVPLVAGRVFDERDGFGKPDVVIVNETLARRYFPGVDPVGRRLKDGGPERPDNPWMTIVGVVGDVKYSGLAAPPEPTFYLSYRRSPQRGRFLAIRTSTDPAGLAGVVRSTVTSLDKDLAISRVRTIDELMARTVAPPRFRAMLVTIFAVAGLLLAAIGIYGVMAYSVVQRNRELGIRMALGARRAQVFGLVLRQAAGLTAAGLAVGVAGAALLSRYLGTLLFGLSPLDAITFAGVSLLFAVVAAGAAALPARRATKVDPLVALHSD